MVTQEIQIGDLPIPDARPIFLVVLGVHIAAGLWCVVTGAATALTAKRSGRHPRLGLAYFWGLAAVTASMAVLAILRWPHTVHLLVIGVISMACATVGVTARRRRRPGWVRLHGSAMAASYVGLLTGFLVDNGPLLPGWRELPHVLHWTLPTLVALPLLVRALSRYGPRSDRRDLAHRSL